MPLRPEPSRLPVLALGAAALAAAVAFAPALLGRTAAAVVTNALIAAAAVAVVVLAERRARRSRDEANGWRHLALAGILATVYRGWQVASVMVTGTPPGFPDDTQYLQPLLLVVVSGALLTWASRGRSRRGSLRSGLDGFLAGTSVLFVIWAATMHQPGWHESLTRFEEAVIVADLAVIAASLGLFVHLTGSVLPRIGGPLTFIGAALLAASLCGLGVAHLGARGRYFVGHPVDALALLAAVLFALSTLAPGSVVPEADTPPPARRVQAASLLPYLPLVASLLTAALLLGQPDGESDRFLTGLALVLSIALLLRQQLALRDVEQLSHHLTETAAARTLELARTQSALARAQRLEAVGRMAGGVARDFDRLIADLDAPVAVLAATIAPTHPDREAVEEIASAGRRAQRLTAQLLTFAQRQRVEPRAVDVNALLADALPLLRQLAGRAIALELHTAPGAAMVFADPTQIEQLLSNLTVNSRDAMPDGGTLRIAVASAEAEDAGGGPGEPVVRFTVTDTGCGMDEQVLAHIFEPFYTTKPAGKGTGLGLPTCYGIVSRAGGRIRVESTPGTGTTVTVDLPRAR